jgi:carboxypeptidase Q
MAHVRRIPGSGFACLLAPSGAFGSSQSLRAKRNHYGFPSALAIAVSAFLSGSCGFAAEPVPASPSPAVTPEVAKIAAKLRTEALAGTQSYEIVRSLTVEVGPRLAGSPGDARGVEWAKKKLAALGFQNVRAEPVEVPHWERGRNAGEILSPWPQPVALTALGGSVATPTGGVEAEVLGVATLDELKKLDPAQAKGKILFVSQRMERTPDGSGYGAAVGMRGTGAAEAAKRGAVGLLIRSVGTDSNRLPHTGAMRMVEGQATVPAAALSGPDSDLLEAELASGQTVRFRLELETKTFPNAPSANVIGEIPGRDAGKANEEFILLGAHLDSWDLGTGAIDDGAGCAIVIETARRIGQLPAAQRPWRTIRVVLFANEEFGLSGARAYAAAHAAELPRHAAAAEADFGSGRVYQIKTRIAPAALPSFAQIVEIAKLLGVAFDPTNDSGGGADLSPLAPANVPVISFNQDGTTYFDLHHSANDTLDKIDPKDLDQVVAAWTGVIYAVAASDLDLRPAPALPARE